MNFKSNEPCIERFWIISFILFHISIIQEDTYRGGINDPLSLNLYTYSHNNPISYYDPTGHSIKKIGDMLKFAATTVKAIVIPNVKKTVKKTAKTLKEDWQSGVDELKKGGVASQGFASYSESVVGSLSTKVNNILHPVETIKTSLSNWGTAIKENPSNIIPNIYMSNQIANGVVTSGIELKTAIETKDLNSICSMAGRGTVLGLEMGLSSFGAKAISGGIAKGAAKGATSATAASSNAITSINPVKNKFFANQKATISRILRDETGSIGIGKNKNVGGGVKRVDQPTGRMNMVGKTHSVSGVEFDASGFPKFKSEYNMNLEPTDY